MLYKTTVIERKVLTEAEWRELLKIVFTLIGMTMPTEDKIKFDASNDGGWQLDVDGSFSIYHAEQENEVKTFRGKERKQLTQGYRWMTYHTTYSYRDGYDMVEREHDFCFSPEALVRDIVLQHHTERVNDALQAFDYAKMEREEEEYNKAVADEEKAKVVAEFQRTRDLADGEPYDELAGDVRDRLEDHNREVLKQL